MCRFRLGDEYSVAPIDVHVFYPQLAMKEKMLMKLERDRIKAKNEAIEAQMKAMQVSPAIS